MSIQHSTSDLANPMRLDVETAGYDSGEISCHDTRINIQYDTADAAHHSVWHFKNANDHEVNSGK